MKHPILSGKVDRETTKEYLVERVAAEAGLCETRQMTAAECAQYGAIQGKAQESAPIGKDELWELIKEKGLQKTLSVVTAKKVPKQRLTEMIDAGLSNAAMARDAGVSLCSISYLRRLYDLQGSTVRKRLPVSKKAGPPDPPDPCVKSEDPAPYTAGPAKPATRSATALPGHPSEAPLEGDIAMHHIFRDEAVVIAETLQGIVRSLVLMKGRQVVVEITVRRVQSG